MSDPDSAPEGPAVPQGQHLPVRESVAGPAGAKPDVVAGAALRTTERLQPSEIAPIQVRELADSKLDVVLTTPMQAPEPNAEGEFWHATVQALIAAEAISAMVRELALQSQLVARDTDQWLLRIERESLNQTSNRERLASALATAGYPGRLAVEVGRVTDSPARRLAAALAQRQLEAEKIIFDDPLVQTMMREFEAKIIPTSIKPL